VICINKDDFLSELDKLIKYEPKESLKKIVLELAQNIERDNYDDLLESLKKPKKAILPIQKIQSVNLLDKTLELCKKIEDGKYQFRYGYGNNYWDYDHLVDKDGLNIEIKSILEDCISYVLNKRYEESLKVFDALFGFKIPMDYYEDVDITALINHFIKKYDLNDILLYYAYSAIMALKGNERCEKIFDIEIIAYCKINIADVEKVSTIDTPVKIEFAKEWVDFLKMQDLTVREHMLIEAIKFSGGTQGLKDFALEFGVQFPYIYIELIETLKDEKKYSEAIEIAMGVLGKNEIDSKYRVKTADLLYGLGYKIDDSDIIRKGIVEGFKLSLDLSHFINLYELKDAQLIKDMVVYMDDKNVKNLYIHFLNGDYELVFNECKDNKSKESMVPLFIALLKKNVSLNNYNKSTIEYDYLQEYMSDDFVELLDSSFLKLSDLDFEKYKDWCISVIDNKVEEIVKGQQRSNYNNAAALIVSFAELILLSDSEANAEAFIQKYRDKYPRHNSFRAILSDCIQKERLKMSFK